MNLFPFLEPAPGLGLGPHMAAQRFLVLLAMNPPAQIPALAPFLNARQSPTSGVFRPRPSPGNLVDWACKHRGTHGQISNHPGRFQGRGCPRSALPWPIPWGAFAPDGHTRPPAWGSAIGATLALHKNRPNRGSPIWATGYFEPAGNFNNTLLTFFVKILILTYASAW